MIDRLGEARTECVNTVRISHHVGVVKAIKGHVQLGDEGEGRLALGSGSWGIVGPGEPGAVECTRAEYVAAGPAEAVPHTDGEAEMILHPLPITIRSLSYQR